MAVTAVIIPNPLATPVVIPSHTRRSAVIIVAVDMDVTVAVPLAIAAVIRAAGRRVAAAVAAIIVVETRIVI